METIIGIGVKQKWHSIIPGGDFTWGEATKDFKRLPPTAEISKNIVKLAREIQPYREDFGQPLYVSSWYRPPDVNKAVGGASNSYHLYGLAVDFSNPNYTGYQLQAYFSSWGGGLGVYAWGCHLDLGPKRSW